MSEIQAVVPVLNLGLAGGDGANLVLDLELSGGIQGQAALVQASILRPFNCRVGHDCLSVGPSTRGDLTVAFAPACRAPEIVGRFGTRPAAALLDAARQRLDEVGSAGAILASVTTI